MEYPKIFLAIDNCFASKRWTTPSRWMRMVKKLGLSYIEASADNECDPLYMDADYLQGWIDQIKQTEAETGVQVVNLYSGHGTYATLGLAHSDLRVRNRMHREWLEAMVSMSGKLHAGLGFFCHAFSQQLLQNPDEYDAQRTDLYDRLADLAVCADRNGLPAIGVEQMYTPHQIPWTVSGAEELLREVHRRSGKNFYITIDTGHQSGQRKFLRPGRGRIKEALREFRQNGRLDGFWIGPRSAHVMFKDIARKGSESKYTVDGILAEMDRYPYLFADYEDGDPYEWLECLGCYSPIIHLQQTDGKKSAHLPFNAQTNENGIIKGDEVLAAIAASYRHPREGMPEPCREIYLTLEIFAGTAELPVDIINKLKDSVAYWRQFIPEDGLALDRLI